MPFTAFDTAGLRAIIAGMSHKALRIYVLLSTYADRKGICWPQVKELSEMSGLHVETVQAALEELESAGLLVYRRRNERDPYTGRMQNNVYFVAGPLLKADSDSSDVSEHEPIRMVKFEIDATNEITNSNNQYHQNQFHKPPPPTTKTPRQSEEQKGKASTMRNGDEEGKEQGQGQPRKNSAAGTAPQNSKASLPPLPPLPHGFDADAEMDQDDEAAARWMVAQAMTRQNGGEYQAVLSMANARRYIARFGRLKCKAAISMVRRDPDTQRLVGRADYLLRTSVSEEAQALQNEIDRMNHDSAHSGD